jgi:hypothetical protein
MLRYLCFFVSVSAAIFPQSSLAAQNIISPTYRTNDVIRIVTGSFGTLGTRRTLDIAAQLQTLCGPDAQSCRVFCSETSFGRYDLGRRPICRVTYRCGPSLVRSVEAMREEPLLMKCPDPIAEPPAAPSPPPAN